MGSLELRPGARVYVDSQILIYSVERHPDYGSRLPSLWTASRDPQIQNNRATRISGALG